MIALCRFDFFAMRGVGISLSAEEETLLLFVFFLVLTFRAFPQGLEKAVILVFLRLQLIIIWMLADLRNGKRSNC
jgi:hypothetical protein